MKRTALKILVLLTLGLLTTQGNARIEPSFSLEESAWKATDIVVAFEGDVIDGKLQVLEAWKGDLKKGNSLDVPEMKVFAPNR